MENEGHNNHAKTRYIQEQAKIMRFLIFILESPRFFWIFILEKIVLSSVFFGTKRKRERTMRPFSRWVSSTPPTDLSPLLSLSWTDFSSLVQSSFPSSPPSLTSSFSDPSHTSSPYVGASAAVTILFFPQPPFLSPSLPPSPHLLMLKKRKRGRHGGQIAFPGGMVDYNGTDNSLFHTAMRELEEEVGLVMGEGGEGGGGRVGCLPRLFVTDTTSLSAACFVAAYDPTTPTPPPTTTQRWTLDEEEIEVAMEVPLSALLDHSSLYPSVSLSEGTDVSLHKGGREGKGEGEGVNEVYTIRGAAENMPPIYTGPVFAIPNNYHLYQGFSPPLPFADSFPFLSFFPFSLSPKLFFPFPHFFFLFPLPLLRAPPSCSCDYLGVNSEDAVFLFGNSCFKSPKNEMKII